MSRGGARFFFPRGFSRKRNLFFTFCSGLYLSFCEELRCVDRDDFLLERKVGVLKNGGGDHAFADLVAHLRAGERLVVARQPAVVLYGDA